MPRDKTDTYHKIIPSAKREFLRNGYEKTSLQSIAVGAGITAAGLYRHFPDKQSIFAHMVSPLLKEFDEMYQGAIADTYAHLNVEELKGIWNDFSDKVVNFIEFVYEYFDEFKLLLCCSEGTPFQNFQHDMVLLEVRETRALLNEMLVRGIPVGDIHEEELHMVTSAYLAAIFEVVIHDYPKEKALGYVKFVVSFFYPGWSNILGF